MKTVVGSLETLWLMLAYAPVAPAPPPAVPPTADAPVAAPAPSAESMAPAPAPAEPAPPVEGAQPAEAPPAEAPPEAVTAAEDAPPEFVTAPEDAPLDANEPERADQTPYKVTLVHRSAVSSSAYESKYESRYEEEDSFEEYFVSGYGGIITRGSAVSRKMGVLRGFHGGLLLGDRLSIGVAYHRLKRRFGAPILDSSNRPLALEMAYGGLEIGATVFRSGRFELGVQTLFGGGAGCVTYDVNRRSNVAECVDGVRMMVLEPSAIANVRVTDWMRVGLEGGYRGVARSSWSEGNDFDLGGGFFGLNLDFGWFARPND
ncbi:MAG: hypothetical protein ACE37F_19825 [Nannocystaceae bacterium]|nr:hypothetical protein [bacterium]